MGLDYVEPDEYITDSMRKILEEGEQNCDMDDTLVDLQKYLTS